MKTYKQRNHELYQEIKRTEERLRIVSTENSMRRSALEEQGKVDPIEFKVIKDSCHMALEALEAIRCIELQARLALPDDKKENKTFSECIAEEALLRIKGE